MRRLMITALIVVGLAGNALAQPKSAPPAKPEGEMR